MTPPQTLRRALPLALLALALLAPTAASAAERTVTVGGSATRKVANDSAAFSFGVSLERRARGAALRATSARLRKVIAAVQAVPGVGPGDLTTGRISVSRVFRGKKPLYRASQGVSVVLHQPDEAGTLVSAAIAAGATGTGGPTYFLADPEAAYNAALVAAFDQARARATALAAQVGATLGPVISIVEGGTPEQVQGTRQAEPVAKDCAASPGPVTAKRCAAPPPTKPGTTTVTARVAVVFALQ